MFTSRGKSKAQTSAIGEMKKKVQKMLDEYEQKHGKVKAYPVK